jgi:hypothetical protein
MRRHAMPQLVLLVALGAVNTMLTIAYRYVFNLQISSSMGSMEVLRGRFA